MGHSCFHTALILQEVIQAIRDEGKKVYVAFLDVKKHLILSGMLGFLLNSTRKA